MANTRLLHMTADTFTKSSTRTHGQACSFTSRIHAQARACAYRALMQSALMQRISSFACSGLICRLAQREASHRAKRASAADDDLLSISSLVRAACEETMDLALLQARDACPPFRSDER
eukprot:6200549-Pleurochrysis_carterae.AAC.1